MGRTISGRQTVYIIETGTIDAAAAVVIGGGAVVMGGGGGGTTATHTTISRH